MAFFTKIYSLFRQPTERVNLSADKYLPYFDANDNWPLKWHEAISNSPSATSCVSTISDFLEGFGFSDPELEKKEVNLKGETFWQIHQKTVNEFAEFEGFYWHFMYNSMGKITSWNVLPFENCRLGKPDSKGYISEILYNPYFGTKDFKNIKQKETISYHCYNPSAVQAQIALEKDKYKGQVYFFGTTTALSRFYPLPEANSAIKWMKIEAGVADYHEDNITNGFLQAFMMAMIGNPDEVINNPEASSTDKPMTVGEAFDLVLSQGFMGAKRVGNMLVHWVRSKEELPQIINMPSNGTGDLFLAVDTQATKKITIAFKVPAILANINEGVSLGGDGNMVRVAVKLMQQRVIKRQRMLTDAYSMIWANFVSPYIQDISISPYNPYPELEILDDKIWNAMTSQEQRDWIEKNTEIELMDEDLAPAPIKPGIQNVVPVPFPDKVRAMAKKALEYQDNMGLKCSGRGGRQVAEAIMNNQNLGLKHLKRIYNYLKKRPNLANAQFSDGCNVLEYNAWGGKEMELFLEGKLKELDQWLN